DVTLMSPKGFTDEDIKKVKEITGVESVHAGYSFDAYAMHKKNEKAVKVYSLEKVNRPFLRKGLLPKKDNEVVTEEMYMEKEHLHIGDTIQLKTVNGMKEV